MSSHQTLGAVRFAQTHLPTLNTLWVLGDDPDSQGIKVVDLHGTPTLVEPPSDVSITLDPALLTTGVLCIEYLYRDGCNNKQHSTAYITGPFTKADLCAIATALTAGEDESFIPHQLGLNDLQDCWETPLYDEGLDGPWHEPLSIALLTPVHADLAALHAATWMPIVYDRLASGYDLTAAMRHLAPSLY